MDNQGFFCGFCDQRFLQLIDIQDHLRNFHNAESNEGQRCGINNCSARYRNPNSLKSHRSRVHRREIINNEVLPNIQELENEIVQEDVNRIHIPHRLNEDNVSEEDDGDEEEDDDEEVEEVDFEPSSSDDTPDENTDYDEVEDVDNNPGINDERKRALGRFLLNLRGNTNVSEKQITGILTMLQDVVRTYVGKSLRRLEQVLQERDINDRDYFDLNNEIESSDCIFDLHKKEKRETYLRNEFDVLMPIRHTLGRRFVKYGSAATGKNCPTKHKKDEMMFIPITKIIQKFAANDSFHGLLKYHDLREGIFASVEDGSRYKNDTWWKFNDESFHIKLYSDEVDMCDGLGSKSSGQQKLLMIYCSLTDLDPIHQSQLLFQFLVGIARSEDLKRYGMNKILRPIVNDIKLLEEGIEGPNDTIIKGGLFVTIGDNVAQNCHCGLKQSFGRTQHSCRFCLADLSEIRTLTEEKSHLIRNPEDHDRQVLEIENAEGVEKEQLSTAYGINIRSILNELNGFHVSEGSPPDIVHDILLSLLPEALQHFAQKVILKKISLSKFNRLIQNFDYGYSETKYKPSPLKAKHLIPGANIKQNAMQMMTLGYIIPFIVRDIVETNGPYYYNYRNMLEITMIVFGYSISNDMVEYLGDSISEYLEDFATLYGDEDVNAAFTPKHHFLTHYPSLITIFGPLRNYMCLRSEAKHQESKRRVQGMRNYKNLPYTLAVRHQLSQALQLLEPLIKPIQKGPLKIVPTAKLPFYNLFPQEPLQCITNWIIYNGVKYVPQKCLIAVGYDNSERLPSFAALDGILIRDEEIIYICKKVTTVEYNTELVSYEVNIEREFISITPENIINHEIFHIRKSRNKLFVNIKHCFGNLY